MIRLDYETRCRLTDKYNEDRVFQLLCPILAKFSGTNDELTPVELFDEALRVTERLKSIKVRRDIAINQIWSELLERYREYGSKTKSDVVRDEEAARQTAVIVATIVVFLLTNKDKDVEKNPYRPIITRLTAMIKHDKVAQFIIDEADRNEVVEEQNYGEIPPNDYLHAIDDMDVVRKWMGKMKNHPDKIASWFKPHFDQFVEDILSNPQICAAMKKNTFNEGFNMKLLINIWGIMVTEKAVLWSRHGLLNEIANMANRNKPIAMNNYQDYNGQHSELDAEMHDFIQDSIRKYNPAKKAS